MPYILIGAKDLVDKPLIGKGDCVELVKLLVPGLKGLRTSAWKEGIRVAPGNVITPGTAIATFVNGRYPNDRTGQHAAVFVAYAGASLWIIDQWIGLKAVQMRLIRPVLRGGSRGADGRYPDASNNPAAFSVIER